MSSCILKHLCLRELHSQHRSVTRCVEMSIPLQGILWHQLGVLQFSSVLILTIVHKDSRSRDLDHKSQPLMLQIPIARARLPPSAALSQGPYTFSQSGIASEHRKPVQVFLIQLWLWQRTQICGQMMRNRRQGMWEGAQESMPGRLLMTCSTPRNSPNSQFIQNLHHLGMIKQSVSPR